MAKDMNEHYLFLKNTLLSISGGSWVVWAWLKQVSEFCSLVLPITGVFSFVIYLIINYKNYQNIQRVKDEVKKEEKDK